MPVPRFLGNDLVHWSGSDAQEKSADSRAAVRFAERVLHSSEHALHRRLIDRGDGENSGSLSWSHALWALWAAKESAFKAASKAMPGLSFSPRSIVVCVDAVFQREDPDEAHSDHAGRPLPECPEDIRKSSFAMVRESSNETVRPFARGRAIVQRQWYDILWESCDEFVHALAVGPVHARSDHSDGWNRILRRTVPTERFLSASRHACRNAADRGSAAVRELACNLARTLPRLRSASLEIRRVLGPDGTPDAPRLHDLTANGREPVESVDLSLSHDGPWSAAAVMETP